MKSRAAVAFEAGKPLEIVEVDLEGPRAERALQPRAEPPAVHDARRQQRERLVILVPHHRRSQGCMALAPYDSALAPNGAK